jgi:hypothetical protein
MTLHLVIVLGLAATLLALLRARLIQVDLLFPWFVALAIVAFASTSPPFVNWLGGVLGIAYAPIAVVFLVYFLQLGIIISISISLSRLRERQVAMAEYMALRDLAQQEQALRSNG